MTLNEEIEDLLRSKFHGREATPDLAQEVKDYVRWYIDRAVPGADEQTVRVFMDVHRDRMHVQIA